MRTPVLPPPRTKSLRRAVGAVGGPIPASQAILPWWAIASYPVLWMLGLAFFFWPLLLVRVALIKRPRRIPPGLITAIPVLLALSLALAVSLGETEPGRAISAVYNIIIWEFLVVALSIRWTSRDLQQLVRGIVSLATVQGVVVFAAIWSYPAGSGLSPLITKILPASLLSDASAQSFLVNNLAFADYYSGPVLRTSGFFGHPNWGAGLAGIATILAVAELAKALRPGSRRALSLRIFQLTSCAVPLQYAYSRTTVVAVALGLAVGVAVLVCTVTPRKVWVTILAGGVTLTAAVAATVDWTRAYHQFNEPRLGSLISRSDIYRSTWHVILNHPVTVLGVGTKERVPGLAASLGTHSTYLGLVYRGGWAAAISFVLALIALLWFAIRRGQWLAAALVCFVGLWATAEDLDVGHFMPLGLLTAFLLVNLEPAPETAVSDIPRRWVGWWVGDVLTDKPLASADNAGTVTPFVSL